MNEMTHYLSICNGLALLIRYNEGEDMIEYKYTDSDETVSTPITYKTGEPVFFIGGVSYCVNEFCKINI